MFNKNILIVSPHHDDAEIFAGGTISRLIRENFNVFVCIVTNGNNNSRITESVFGLRELGILDKQIIQLDKHVDTQVYKTISILITELDSIIQSNNIKTVFTSHYSDSHQDHKSVSEASLAAARHCDNVIYFHPGWPSGRTNIPFSMDLLVKLSESDLNKKVSAIAQHKSQIIKYGKEDYLDDIKYLARADLLRYHGYSKEYAGAETFEINRLVW